MFIFTARFSKKKAVAGVVIGGLLLALLINCIPSKEVAAYHGDTAMDAMAMAPVGDADTEEGRLEFLENLGWEVGGASAAGEEVVIPRKFDAVYDDYNTMQKNTGYDLSKYKGKKVTLYSYNVINHPNGDENVHANLLVYKGKIVGGDISSTRLDGFMHGLSKRE